MDLLFKEYASPFVLLDNIIASGRLIDFLEVFEMQRNERARWEFFIHKLPPWDDTSWEDFNAKLDASSVREEGNIPTKQEIETTITESQNILSAFTLEERR